MMRFLYMVAAIGKAIAVTRDHQRKIKLNDQKIILNEAHIAQANNNVVLGDIKIEQEKLKLEVMEKEVHPPAWHEPTSYDSPHALS